jgi:hypothetical protein
MFFIIGKVWSMLIYGVSINIQNYEDIAQENVEGNLQ